MTRRIRLLMLVLAVVIVALGTGLIILNQDTSLDTGDSKSTQPAGREGYYIFQDDDTGLYGVRNENDRVLVDAEWNSLSFSGEQTLLVSRRTGGALRYGMIQINENVRIPFAYSSITPLTGQILAAVTAEDEKTILYNTEGQQLLSQAWDSCVAEDGVLRLMSGTAQYTAEVSGSTRSTIRMTAVTMRTVLAGEPLYFSFDAEDLAGVESYTVLAQLAQLSHQYLKAMLRQDYSDVYSITAADSYSAVIDERRMQNRYFTSMTLLDTEWDESDPVLRYACTFRFCYRLKTDVGVVPQASNLILRMRRDADGLLLLYSVEEQPVDMQTGQVIMDSTKGADEKSSGGKYE